MHHTLQSKRNTRMGVGGGGSEGMGGWMYSAALPAKNRVFKISSGHTHVNHKQRGCSNALQHWDHSENADK